MCLNSNKKRTESPMFSTAKGTALGIRHLRTIRPAKGSSNVSLFFLQLPLQQDALVVSPCRESFFSLPREKTWLL